jgi:hypothetical protein
MKTRRPIARAACIALAALTLTAGGISEAAAATSHVEARHCKIKIKGKKVAVRKPASGDKVARPNSPVVRYVHRGNVIRNSYCLIALGRSDGGPVYNKCGKDGYNWYVVIGGQVPVTCAARVR